VNALPSEWRLHRLSELGYAFSGLSGKSKDDFGTGSSYVPYKNVFLNTFVDLTYVQHVNVAPDEAQNKVQTGDVLLTISSETPEEVGMSAVVANEVTGDLYLNSFCFGFRPTIDGLLPRYLGYAFRSPYMRKKLVFLAQGSTRFNISKGRVLEIELPIPPVGEQKKIAAILTTVDDKLDVIARQTEAIQTLKKGLMQTLFSRGIGTQDSNGPWVPHTEFKDSELGEIPAGWTVAPLGELIEKLMDFRGRTPKKLGMDWGGGVIPALSANNVRMGYIDFDRECYLGSDELYAAWMVQGDTRKNDLVFTMEAPLGNVAVIPDDRKYILSQRVVLLRANQRVKHSYLFQYLRSDTFRKILEANSTGTTAKGIQQKRLVQLPVVVPSQDEQERIADMLSAIDGKLDALLSKQSHHQTLKRGLMQKLLMGEWRVSVDANTTGA
jgi:type I restriction enzyme S subunit